jgi:hypothetical protein
LKSLAAAAVVVVDPGPAQLAAVAAAVAWEIYFQNR